MKWNQIAMHSDFQDRTQMVINIKPGLFMRQILDCMLTKHKFVLAAMENTFIYLNWITFIFIHPRGILKEANCY